MKIRIATWNLNTWINRRDKGISNTQLWAWADENLVADVMIFTEAETPPPRTVTSARWTTAHRPLGFPGVSKWGTVIAGRTASDVRVERITHVGPNESELDTKFPGTFTAADLFINDECIATIVGLHLRYRKDKAGNFVGHPGSDLDALKKDFEALFADRQQPLIIAGDFNEDMEEFPKAFKKLGKDDFSLVDAFAGQPQATFQQDWGARDWYRMDYVFLSKVLNNAVTVRIGGNVQFGSALEMSDHSPLLIEIDLNRLRN